MYDSIKCELLEGRGNVINLEVLNNNEKILFYFSYIMMSSIYIFSEKWHTLISLTKQILLPL